MRPLLVSAWLAFAACATGTGLFGVPRADLTPLEPRLALANTNLGGDAGQLP